MSKEHKAVQDTLKSSSLSRAMVYKDMVTPSQSNFDIH
jgi:hypothetical protein